MITIHETAQGTAEWHEAREGKFTGSLAYKLLGSSGANEYAKATRTSFKGNYHTKRGVTLEPEAIELYEAIKGVSVARPGFVTNDRFNGCLYSPDGILEDVLIEVKCFSELEHMKIYNGDIKLSVLAQVHFGLMICEKQLAHLVIYNPTLDPEKAFKIILIKANKNIQSNFKRILTA